jgi:hypothetical protein
MKNFLYLQPDLLQEITAYHINDLNSLMKRMLFKGHDSYIYQRYQGNLKCSLVYRQANMLFAMNVLLQIL